MVQNIGRIPLALGQPRWREAIQVARFVAPDEKEIWKIKGVCVGLWIKRRTDGALTFTSMSSRPIRRSLKASTVSADREFRRELDRTMLAAAHAFKDECREVALHFLETAAIPIAEFATLVEERNGPPLAFVVDEFCALNRMRSFESTLQIALAKSAEQRAQLDEEFPAVLPVLGRLDYPLALRKRIGAAASERARNKRHADLSSAPSHNTTLLDFTRRLFAVFVKRCKLAKFVIRGQRSKVSENDVRSKTMKFSTNCGESDLPVAGSIVATLTLSGVTISILILTTDFVLSHAGT